MKKLKNFIFPLFLSFFMTLLLIGTFIISEYSKSVFDQLPIILAVIAIVMTMIITITQHNQIIDLKDINKAVLKITDKLRMDTDVSRNIQNLFAPRNQNEERFICYFPVKYRSSPLPTIFEGDFFALQVLTKYLKSNLKYEAVYSNQEFDLTSFDQNVIFVCTPAVNSALRKAYPPYNVNSNNEYHVENNNVKDLPCWFFEKCVLDNLGKQKLLKGIHVFGNINRPLESPAEGHYDRAKELENNDLEMHKLFFKECTDKVADYGIFARITNEKGKHLIISGIHQYGTWIVAEYLNNLLSMSDEQAKDSYISKKEDFIAIICGEFYAPELKVDNTAILEKFFWYKDGNIWIRGENK